MNPVSSTDGFELPSSRCAPASHFLSPKSTMQKIALPLVACLLAIAATDASAQAVYKWRDAGGQMHISDTPPPPDVPARNILQRPNGAALVVHDAASAASEPAQPNAGDAALLKKKARLDQEKAQADALEKAKADQKQADARAAACTAAQQNVRTMTAGGRIVRINANGEREYLDDAAIANELKRAQDAAAQSCGPAKSAATP
jgi:hypothetical protein